MMLVFNQMNRGSINIIKFIEATDKGKGEMRGMGLQQI